MAGAADAARAARLRYALDFSARMAAQADAALERYVAGLDRVNKLVAPTVARTQALRAARDEVRAALEHAEQALDHLDAARRLEPVILAGPEADVDAFLDALSALDAAAAYLTRAKDVAAAPPALDGVLALRRDGLALALRNFGTLLRLHAADVDGDRGVDKGYGLAGEDGQDGGETPPLRAPSDESGGRWSSGRSTAPRLSIPDAVAGRLQALAEAMLASGDKSCIQAFVDARRHAAARALRELQTLSLDSEDPASGSVGDDQRVNSWAHGLRTLTTMVLTERDLASAIFEAPHDGEAYAAVLSGATDMVADAGRAVVAARRSPDKVLMLVALHRELEQGLESLAPAMESDLLRPLHAKLAALLAAMQAEAQITFEEYKMALKRPETWRVTVADGSIHPVVAQALLYLRTLFEQDTAAAVLAGDDLGGDGTFGGALAASAMLMRVLQSVVTGLDAKARTSKSKAAATVFTMNNLQYAITAIDSSASLAPVPAEWLETQRATVESLARDLRALLWGPLSNGVACLQAAGTGLTKDAAKALNVGLLQLEEASAQLAIVSADLRGRLRSEVEADVVVPFEALWAAGGDGGARKHLKVTPADARRVVDEASFFVLRDDAGGRGVPTVASGKWR